MKLILSRKGFDSSAGGVPSPILPDGRLISLPIPDSESGIVYNDITHSGLPLGPLVQGLTRGRIKGSDGAHLDPDLLRTALPRQRGWRPLFGQFGAAQSHLHNQKVGAGDLFLFFGLFREIDDTQRWLAGTGPRHVLWGWFQASEIVTLSKGAGTQPPIKPWAHYHPHIVCADRPGNTLYIAARQLKINGENTGLPGCGTFSHFSSALQLTAPTATRRSQWQLPPWFYPAKGKTPLSYHHNPGRWRKHRRHVALQTVARGQEFVLDSSQYPQAPGWACTLIRAFGDH